MQMSGWFELPRKQMVKPIFVDCNYLLRNAFETNVSNFYSFNPNVQGCMLRLVAD